MNLNPRSLFNKLELFKLFILEHKVDLTLVSESWEREDQTIRDILDDDSLTVISNPFQRKGRGGRPVIIVKHTN